ncbi:MAG: PAS domain S-box protein [bacterium]
MIILIIAIGTAIVILFGILVGRPMLRNVDDDFRDRGVILADTTAELITNNVINREVLPTLENISDILERSKDVEYIYVVGFDGNVLAHTFKGGFPRDFAALLDEDIRDVVPRFRSFLTEKGPVLDVERNLIGGMRARINIGINQGPQYALIDDMRKNILGAALGIMVLSILIGVVLSKRIARPLDNLARSMKAFGEGRVDVSGIVVSSGGLEVRQLADSFNRMISERRLVEKDLRETEHRFRELFNRAADAVILHDYEGKIIDANAQACSDLGYSYEEILSLNLVDIETSFDMDAVRKICQTVRYDAPLTLMGVSRRKDGTTFPAEARISLFEWSGQQLLLASIRDISERVKAEEEIEKANARLQFLLSASPAMIYTCDAGGGWAARFVSKNIKDILGYDYHENLENPTFWIDRVHPEDLARVLADLDRLLADGSLVHEYRFLHKNGTYRWMHDEAKIIRDAEGKPLECIGYYVDVTERKRMEEELFRAEKLESLGILAGGLAHDFNNILTAILGNISLARHNIADQDAKADLRLEEAEKAVLRARDLTQQLLTFSKGGAPVKKTVSLRGVLNDSASFVLRGSDVKCEITVPDDAWPVEADEGQLSQVINNLVINADQAMPGGGIIRIQCENTVISRDGGLSLDPGRYVTISVRDEGTGIAEEHLDKIFEPFFTTKEKGSGLGLATSYSIVKNHGGIITVESEQGKGSTFSIYLPASDKAIPAAEAGDESPIGGKGRILLMDDEDMILDVGKEALSHLGYEVEGAHDGDEAVARYREARQSGRPFDAVIMDLTIPGGMGGRDAVRKILEIDPAAKVIVSSGYSNDPIMADFKTFGFSGVVSKPYKIQTLSKALHDVMAGTDE